MFQDQESRIILILQTLKSIEESDLSVTQYFQITNLPFSEAQYYHYKKILCTKGLEGLNDQRAIGNNLKFSEDIQIYVKGLLEHNPSLSTSDIQKDILKQFNITISTTTLKNFRRDNNLKRIDVETDNSLKFESSAAEIPLALALDIGLMDMFTDTIDESVQEIIASGVVSQSEQLPKDYPELRLHGKFTSKYNNLTSVRESRFKPIEEKIPKKRFISMDILSLSKESIFRRTLGIFLLPLITQNGRVSSADSPDGNALKSLCNYNYKASTLTKHIAELKYLRISNNLIMATARFWIDFWKQRNHSGTIFTCYYIDGNTKALWSSKSCHKGKVTMLGRVMNCLEQVFIHDGKGHPIYFQTFNGHVSLGNSVLSMMNKIEEYIRDPSNLNDNFSINRIIIMDGGGNGVKTLRELSDSGYHFITILDSNQITDRKIKLVSEEKRYEFGDASLKECRIELEDSNEKNYIFETRAIQVYWDNGRTCVLITSLDREIVFTDHVVKSYFDRWPAQELNFKDMKNSVNIHRIVGYGKKLVDNQTVLKKIELLQIQKTKIEQDLTVPLAKIRELEKSLQIKIDEEKILKEKSNIFKGIRTLSDHDLLLFHSIEKDINNIKKTILNIKGDYSKQFKSLKKKNDELARIIDKKQIYSVDVELDQIMTCFKISMANICCYLLDKCFNSQKMTFNHLLDVILNLRAIVRIENDSRYITIKKNIKQPDIMEKLQTAITMINDMKIKDMNGYQFIFSLL